MLSQPRSARHACTFAYMLAYSCMLTCKDAHVLRCLLSKESCRKCFHACLHACWRGHACMLPAALVCAYAPACSCSVAPLCTPVYTSIYLVLWPVRAIRHGLFVRSCKSVENCLQQRCVCRELRRCVLISMCHVCSVDAPLLACFAKLLGLQHTHLPFLLCPCSSSSCMVRSSRCCLSKGWPSCPCMHAGAARA